MKHFILRAAPLVLAVLSPAGGALAAGQNAMVLPANMAVLKCEMPDASRRFLGSSAPGQIFFPREPVDVRLALARAGGGAKAAFTVEIREITTRDPAARIKGSFTDTAGLAPRIAAASEAVRHRLDVTFGEKPTAQVEIKALPVPEKLGTYALILEAADGTRRFLATVARVRRPRKDGRLDNTPIFGESAMFDRVELYARRAACYARMGVRGMRYEIGWSERKDGTCQWQRTDAFFQAAAANRIQLMVTLGGHPQWVWPFSPHQTPASVRPNWDGNPYWGQSDWLCHPKDYPRYARWVTAFCRRYWKDGRGALWGLDNYNEPWEGGGISGWARDCLEYRAIQKLLAESARKVSPLIKLCAASSIMNTEDKLYSDGSRAFDEYVDVFTDHYVVPSMCYGPMVAAAHGKESVETETWFVNSEYLLPQIVQFLASGQKRLSPWHPRVLFDGLPGSKDPYLIPTPLVAATAAFNRFLTGRPFERIVFHDHLPWVFQFGGDADADGMLVVFGQLMTISGDSPRQRLWAQVDGSPGGTMTIDNRDGLLAFFDLAGNPQYVGQVKVTLPMSIFPTYVKCRRGPKAAAERLRVARIEGKRPVEILPRDFSRRIDGAGAALAVELHNCLNRAVRGKLTVTPPAGVALSASTADVALAAGQRKTVTFPVASARPAPANNYPFAFRFDSDAGRAEYAEVMNVALAAKGTKTIDGRLDDWKDDLPIVLVARAEKAEATERLRRPWLELKDRRPDGTYAEVRFAWDADFLYLAARVNDPTPQAAAAPMAGRDENAYFHTKASDRREPYRTFLKEHPGLSFAAVPFVYCTSPESPSLPGLPTIPFRRDRVQIALDTGAGWHDLKPTTDRVPYGFHAVPDSDYEYSLYWCEGNRSELWRHLAPGVPRIHDFPRQPRGSRTTGPVGGARHAARREGSTYVYEAAIPKAELAEMKLAPGTRFGLMFRIGNNKGPNVDYGTDKAVTKSNGLTLHPYWERSSNCGVRWTLGG